MKRRRECESFRMVLRMKADEHFVYLVEQVVGPRQLSKR